MLAFYCIARAQVWRTTDRLFLLSEQASKESKKEKKNGHHWGPPNALSDVCTEHILVPLSCSSRAELRSWQSKVYVQLQSVSSNNRSNDLDLIFKKRSLKVLPVHIPSLRLYYYMQAMYIIRRASYITSIIFNI